MLGSRGAGGQGRTRDLANLAFSPAPFLFGASDLPGPHRPDNTLIPVEETQRHPAGIGQVGEGGRQLAHQLTNRAFDGRRPQRYAACPAPAPLLPRAHSPLLPTGHFMYSL